MTAYWERYSSRAAPAGESWWIPALLHTPRGSQWASLAFLCPWNWTSAWLGLCDQISQSDAAAVWATGASDSNWHPDVGSEDFAHNRLRPNSVPSLIDVSSWTSIFLVAQNGGLHPPNWPRSGHNDKQLPLLSSDSIHTARAPCLNET